MKPNGKHQAFVQGGARLRLKAAEILEMLDSGMPLAEIDVPAGIIIEPTRGEFEACCLEIGIQPPPWPPPSGWCSQVFMMAQRLRNLEPPFCWQCKKALRRIREHLDGDSLLPFALGTYLALTENASNKGAEEFTTLQSHLAHLAGGFSTRTLRRVLPILREIGVIDYTTPRLRGPITFRLLAVPPMGRNDGPDRPNDGPDRPNVRPGKLPACLADNRINSEKELREETREEHTPQGVRADREEAFAEFWKAYPKKRGKAAALKAWKKLKPPLPKVLETIAAFTASREWRKDNGQFIPYPAGWLNAGGWDDELPARRTRDIL